MTTRPLSATKRQLRLSPRDRVAMIGFSASAMSVVGVFWLQGATPLVEHPLGLVLLTLAFAASERLLVSMEARQQAIGYNPSEVALAVGILMLGPVEVVVARLLGSIPSMALNRGSPMFKLAYNASMMAAEATVAIGVYWLVSDALGTGTVPTWVALNVGITTGLLLGGLLVAAAIGQFEGGLNDRLRRAIIDAPIMLLPPTLFASTVAIPMANDWRLGLLALTPLPLLWLAFRSHARLLSRYNDLSSVHDFTRHLGDALDLDNIARVTADQLAEQLRAEDVTVQFWTEDGPPVRASVGHVPSFLPDRPDDPRWVTDLSRRRILRSSDLSVGNKAVFDAEGHEHAMVLALDDEQGPLGLVFVDGRGGASRTFADDDASRLATMAQQLTVVVRKGHLHERIAFEAAHDRLTGLPNRSHYEQRVTRAIEQRIGGAALLIDLDRFKQINDTFGHHAGDALLIEVARRIDEVCGDDDVIARFGGDEYAVFTPKANAAAAQVLAEQICVELERSFDLGPATVAIGASVGIALLGHHGSDAASLLRSADLAMYDAKNRRVRARLYHEALTTDTAERLTLLDDLRAALRDHTIDVHFQPQLDLESGLISGAEALARWEHPRLGRVAPDVFVELAEQSGLIEELTRQVLSKAMTAAARWHQQGRGLRVSVNVSAQSLMDEGLEPLVAEALLNSGVDPSLIVLEITETTMMGDASQVYTNLESLSELGVRLSVDDFGTGFSSLVNLRRLDVDEIKIDKSFVMQMMLEHDDEVIVRSTIELGHNLGLTVVAEGVETSVAMARLRELGCDTVQGYGLSRPLPEASFERWLAERATPPLPSDEASADAVEIDASDLLG